MHIFRKFPIKIEHVQLTPFWLNYLYVCVYLSLFVISEVYTVYLRILRVGVHYERSWLFDINFRHRSPHTYTYFTARVSAGPISPYSPSFCIHVYKRGYNQPLQHALDIDIHYLLKTGELTNASYFKKFSTNFFIFISYLVLPPFSNTLSISLAFMLLTCSHTWVCRCLNWECPVKRHVH